ncbi:MAG: hemolysin family protein [Methanobacteriaceae archaeon]|nr:hemolysin family protein [Methanobacteriaceae archaeon]
MSNTVIILEIILIAILILFTGLLTMSEFAIVASRKITLQKMSNDGNKKAEKVIKLIEDPNEFLSTAQIGITLIGIVTGAIGGTKLSEPLGAFLAPYVPYSSTISFIIVIAITTYFTILIGELVPKRMGLDRPEKMAIKTVSIINVLANICRPIVNLLNASTDFILKIIGSKPDEDNLVTEEAVEELIEEGIEDGTIEEEEKEIIKRVFRLDDQKVDMIMTPRNEMVWLDLEDDEEANMAKIIESERSIFPVSEGELDDFIGVVQTKDLLSSIYSEKDLDLNKNIRKNIKKPLVVPENLLSMELLHEFKENQKHVHMVIIVDEFGSVVGLITLNDLLECIVGDIPGIDEEDAPRALERKDGTWLIDGRYSISEFKELFDIEKELPEEVEDGFTTIAGFILSYANKIPEIGEIFNWKNFSFEIVDMDGNHIDEILVTIIEENQEDEESD